MKTKATRLFLCYAREDTLAVKAIYQKLLEAGFNPWMDKKDLLPGQNWQIETPKVLKSARFVIIFFSKNSVSKLGYVQREFKLALDTLEEMPEGRLYIIPVRLDDCQVPASFEHIHYCDLFEKGGFELVLKTIKSQRHEANQQEKVGIKLEEHQKLLKKLEGQDKHVEAKQKEQRKAKEEKKFGEQGIYDYQLTKKQSEIQPQAEHKFIDEKDTKGYDTLDQPSSDKSKSNYIYDLPLKKSKGRVPYVLMISMVGLLAVIIYLKFISPMEQIIKPISSGDTKKGHNYQKPNESKGNNLDKVDSLLCLNNSLPSFEVVEGTTGVRRALSSNSEDRNTSKLILNDVQIIAGAACRDTDTITKSINQQSTSIEYCYKKSAKANSALHGRIEIEIVIYPNGRVFQTKVLESSVEDQNLESCILRTTKRWRFGNSDCDLVKVQFLIILEL